MSDSEDPPPPDDSDSIQKHDEKQSSSLESVPLGPGEPSEPTENIEPEVPDASLDPTVLPKPDTPLGPEKCVEPVVLEDTVPPIIPAESSEPADVAENNTNLEPAESSVDDESSNPTKPLDHAVPSDAIPIPEPALQPETENSENQGNDSEYETSPEDGDGSDGAGESPPPESDEHIENGEVNSQEPDPNNPDGTETVQEPVVYSTDFVPPLEGDIEAILLPKTPRLDPVVSRARWGALPPHKPIPQRKGLISRVICSHTNSSTCETEDDCVRLISSLQQNFMRDMGNIDLPYNFLVGGDGRVYEGRGWHGLAPFPKYIPDYYNDSRYLEIGFVGRYVQKSGEVPSELMVQARRNLVKYGREQGYFEGNKEVLSFMLARI